MRNAQYSYKAKKKEKSVWEKLYVLISRCTYYDMDEMKVSS